MKSKNANRWLSLVAVASSMCFSALLLAGCGGANGVLSPTPTSVGAAIPARRHRARGFSTIYTFKGAPDGAIPEAGLTLFAGKFYGTTTSGGSDLPNFGTVYDVQLDGTEHVLHSFTNSPDGGSPEAGVANLNRSLYGTTSVGGAHSAGTVYEMKTDGTERVLYSFKCAGTMCKDGANPEGDLAVLNEKLYGTTQLGGTNSDGIVFEVSTDGAERIVHSFTGAPDGDRPHGGLAQLNGSFYGTTELGGSNDSGCVFKVDPDGTESVLYGFKGAKNGDGSAPRAGLTVLNGLLYGVTSRGGAHDDGTVFEVHKDGTERVIYSFNGKDGMFPYAGLTVFKGLLYGTTIRGGENNFGTVFEVNPNGSYRVLHDFTGTDGAGPDATLTVVEGNALIGTTRRGGATDKNSGTVFVVTP